uniref:Uncharacterized protein n=1 Tax=Anguilla anguilla TaxID=7936 RepID=A0A0E9VYN9_ANGAN
MVSEVTDSNRTNVYCAVLILCNPVKVYGFYGVVPL